MKQSYFPGHEKPKKIQVIESGGIKCVIVNGKMYMSWASWDTASQRIVIAQLYKSKFATQQDLSRVFDIHVNSVQKYVADFTKEGLEGLVTQRRGPRETWKLTPGLRAKIMEHSWPKWPKIYLMQVFGGLTLDYINAYSDPFRPPIPIDSGHPFRSNPATHSGAIRPLIPEHFATLEAW